MRSPSRNLLLSFLIIAVGLFLSGTVHVEAARQVERKNVFRPRSALKKPVFGRKRAEKEAVSTGGGGVENNLTNAIAGSVVFALIQEAVKVGLAKADIKFPAMLGGCIFLFFFLLLTEVVSPSAAKAIFDALTPAAGLQAKWIAPFFVPGLVILPLSPSVGGPVEVSCVLLFTIFSYFILSSSTKNVDFCLTNSSCFSGCVLDS